MKLHGKHYRSIWLADNGYDVCIFDQRSFPWEVRVATLTTYEQAAIAIKEMWTRGAPLIGATAAYGMAMAMRVNTHTTFLQQVCEHLLTTRPTAVNLRWALDRMMAVLSPLTPEQRVKAAYAEAARIVDEDALTNQKIGECGLTLIEQLYEKHGKRPLNILTHCNAGWLATVDYGTATAPLYLAHDKGIPLHVWVDETRPRQQGALLTAFELQEHGVPHTVITDNAGGLLMQRGQVDMVIVGTDRVTRNGDVCNKIGTYLKALAAHDNGIPFYVALPMSTFDPSLEKGSDVPIEERDTQEVTHITGKSSDGTLQSVQLTLSPASNLAFDITPARLVSGYITELGLKESL